MRIVFSNSSHKWGGVHQITEQLARGLTDRGHEITLLTRPGSLLHERLADRFDCLPVVAGGDFNPLTVARLTGLLRRLRPQVVLTLMDKDLRLTGAAAHWLGLPVVARRANDQPLSAHLYSRLIYSGIATHHIANSQATRATMLASAPWLDPERITVIHNGIEAGRFQGAAPARLPGPPGVKVGLIGRLEERKGVRDLLDAWPRVSQQNHAVQLFIVGRGPLEQEVTARTQVMERAYFLGYQADVAPILKALDIVVVPSHWEGFGLIAAEAMAAGTPVIATKASSLPEIVRDGIDGLLIPPRDPRALASAILRLLGDPALAVRLARAGRKRVAREFTIDQMIVRYELVMAQQLARHQNRSA